MRNRSLLAALLVLPLALAAATASAHSERETLSPPRPGPVPDPDRVPSEILTVCKPGTAGAPCNFEHIQAAVFAAQPGAKIRVHRGLYKEEPSREMLDLPADNPDGTYSFEFHESNPNAQNLIAVLGGGSGNPNAGKTELTIEGWDPRMNTLADPRDVVVDAGFTKHVGLRSDRATRFIARNLSIYHAREHNFYVLDQDGFLLDRTIGGWAGDYAFLTFATDHGIYSNCEAFGSGDGGVYPGGSADLDQDPVRKAAGDHSVEIANCKSHHNVLGYSGTQGDYIFIHDSEFYDNGVGLTEDSETDHPNYPQNNTHLLNNRFYDNNFNVYADDADITITVFFGEFYLPVGTGVFMASGNANVIEQNHLWDNSTIGVWIASGQGVVVGPTSDPPADPFMSSCNRVVNNSMFPPPDPPPFSLQCDAADCRNDLDLSWDGLGNDNCFEGNQGFGPLGAATADFVPIACTDVPDPSQQCDAAAGVGSPATNALSQVGLLYVEDPNDPSENKPVCWFDATGQTQPCFKDPNQRIGNRQGRNRGDGFVPADDPLSALVATGGGRVTLAGGGSAAFSFDATRYTGGTTGSLKVRGGGVDIVGTIDALHRDAWVGTLDGACTVSGAPGACQIVFFDREFSDATTPTVDASLAPPPGKDADTFSLVATLDAGGTLEIGEVSLLSGHVTMYRPTSCGLGYELALALPMLLAARRLRAVLETRGARDEAARRMRQDPAPPRHRADGLR